MFTPIRVVILAAVVGIAAAVFVSLKAPEAPPESPMQSATQPTSQPAVTLAAGPQKKTPSGLTIIEVKEGTGPVAESGQTVTVNYTGRLFYGGEKFDSSFDHNGPFSFPLGARQVIKGWDEGVAGMKVGGKRQLVIPPDLGYGDRGAGEKIPPGATLIFDVDLVGIEGK